MTPVAGDARATVESNIIRFSGRGPVAPDWGARFGDGASRFAGRLSASDGLTFVDGMVRGGLQSMPGYSGARDDDAGVAVSDAAGDGIDSGIRGIERLAGSGPGRRGIGGVGRGDRGEVDYLSDASDLGTHAVDGAGALGRGALDDGLADGGFGSGRRVLPVRQGPSGVRSGTTGICDAGQSQASGLMGRGQSLRPFTCIGETGRGVGKGAPLSRLATVKARGVRTVASRGREVARGAGRVADGMSRLTHAVAAVSRRIAAAVTSMVGGLAGLPVLTVFAGVIGVLALVAGMLSWLPGFGGSGGHCDDETGECTVLGGTTGSLDPRLVLKGDGTSVDVGAMDLPVITSYERWQCTWWAAARREQIGRPVDPWMGDGYMWRASAERFGYPTGKEPRPGDVMVFQQDVLGADPTYGHVAIVEEVRDDGAVVISEAGVGYGIVALRTFTAAQIDEHRGRIDFIH